MFFAELDQINKHVDHLYIPFYLDQPTILAYFSNGKDRQLALINIPYSPYTKRVASSIKASPTCVTEESQSPERKSSG